MALEPVAGQAVAAEPVVVAAAEPVVVAAAEPVVVAAAEAVVAVAERRWWWRSGAVVAGAGAVLFTAWRRCFLFTAWHHARFSAGNGRHRGSLFGTAATRQCNDAVGE